MKTLFAAILAMAPCARAELIAHIGTDLGTVDAVLQFEKAPQAVANFMTLSQGTRSRIDESTGQVSDSPLYVGEKFFRVINSDTFKIAQTGSGTGTNSGGPGFTFRDEFDPSLRHVPYVLSMANSGPNTNGSQIFLTGNASPSHLDDVHTVFGLVPDPASRAVIDAILAAGNDGSSITDISFSRTDPAALAFDEFNQNLPVVSTVAGMIAVPIEDEVNWMPAQPLIPGDLLSIYRTGDMRNWSQLDAIFAGPDNAPLAAATIDSSVETREFYHLVKVHHPSSTTPAGLATRTLVVGIPDSANTITLVFDEDGEGGTSSYPNDDETTGTIQYVDYVPTGYAATVIFDTSDLVPIRLRLAYDGETIDTLGGRANLDTWNGLSWSPAGSSTFTLTR